MHYILYSVISIFSITVGYIIENTDIILLMSVCLRTKYFLNSYFPVCEVISNVFIIRIPPLTTRILCCRSRYVCRLAYHFRFCVIIWVPFNPQHSAFIK